MIQFMFNMLLTEAQINPADVRLLRHKDSRSDKNLTPFELWQNNRQQFEVYQSTQGKSHQSNLKSKYWASFIGSPYGETIFVGLYHVLNRSELTERKKMPHKDDYDEPGLVDIYELKKDEQFSDFEGKLIIDWGLGERAWIQRADNQNKKVIELKKTINEPVFPGYLKFITHLSEIDSLPITWIEILKNTKGVYLLTCPKTKEQYVGSAYGSDGFWSRWKEYKITGHGNNVALKSRDPSDYQISILEVLGTGNNDKDIIDCETLWKEKLQSRRMGLNMN